MLTGEGGTVCHLYIFDEVEGVLSKGVKDRIAEEIEVEVGVCGVRCKVKGKR